MDIGNKLPVFALYDLKGKYFKTPFIMKTKGEAIRAFTGIANDSRTEIGKFPADFQLVHIGNFSETLGKYENVAHESLGLASDFIVKNENTPEVQK